MAVGRMLVIGVCAMGPIGLIGCPSEPEPEPAEEKDSPEAKRLWKRASDFSARLASMRADLAKTDGLVDASCDDHAIKRKLGMGAGRLLLAEYEYLERHVAPKFTPRYRGESARWKLLTTPALMEIRAPVELESRRSVTDAVYKAQELSKSHRYVGVVRSTKREPPRLHDEKFVAGKLEGWIGIYDIDTGQRACVGSFFVVSPDEIAFNEGTDRQDAIWNDFYIRVRKGLDDAVGRMTRHLVIDWG